MKDSEFKKLAHKISPLKVGSCGTIVRAGYKPDLTVVDDKGSLKFILECEQKTDRKAFLGDVVKAEKYAEECNASPMLIIVMQPQTNTTVKQIAEHLATYAAWLQKRFNGGLKISGVIVISDTEYQASVNNNEVLGSDAFLKRGLAVQI